MDDEITPDDVREVFALFGWAVDEDFIVRYLTDPWIYNLTNALTHTVRRTHARLLD